MANTTIILKKAPSSGSIPGSLANGEIALDYFTGNLWFKAANGTYRLINPAISGSPGQSPDYGTINVNGTLIVSGVQGDILSIIGDPVANVCGFSSNDAVSITINTGLLSMMTLGQYII